MMRRPALHALYAHCCAHRDLGMHAARCVGAAPALLVALQGPHACANHAHPQGHVPAAVLPAQALLHMCASWGVPASEVIMVRAWVGWRLGVSGWVACVGLTGHRQLRMPTCAGGRLGQG